MAKGTAVRLLKFGVLVEDTYGGAWYAPIQVPDCLEATLLGARLLGVVAQVVVTAYGKPEVFRGHNLNGTDAPPTIFDLVPGVTVRVRVATINPNLEKVYPGDWDMHRLTVDPESDIKVRILEQNEKLLVEATYMGAVKGGSWQSVGPSAIHRG